MRNIIIDGDPGHDDVIAFLMALAHNNMFNILGYTTVCGNATVENTTKNILKIMDYLGVQIPVAQGYGEPLVFPLNNAAKFHGESGLDGCANYPEASSKPISKHAVEFLKETISQNKVTLVTMGPLTNIAVLLKTYPMLKENIEEIVVMGGSVNTGNQLAKAEFNMYADPHSAKIVFDSGVHLVLATLEACNTGSIKLKDLEKLKNGGKVSKLTDDILKFYNRWAINNGWDYNSIYDMSTIMYLIDSSTYKSKEMRVDIETEGMYTRGMTVCDDRGPTYIGVCENKKTVLYEGDSQKITQIFFDSLDKLDRMFK